MTPLHAARPQHKNPDFPTNHLITAKPPSVAWGSRHPPMPSFLASRRATSTVRVRLTARETEAVARLVSHRSQDHGENKKSLRQGQVAGGENGLRLSSFRLHLRCCEDLCQLFRVFSKWKGRARAQDFSLRKQLAICTDAVLRG